MFAIWRGPGHIKFITHQRVVVLPSRSQLHLRRKNDAKVIKDLPGNLNNHLGGLHHIFPDKITVTQKLGQRLPEWLRNVLPIPKPELMFTDFPKQTGHVGTLSGIILVNFAVWCAWQVPNCKGFMINHFMHRNTDAENGKVYTFVTSSFSHSDWDHLLGNMVFLAVLGKKVHQLVGRASFCFLYMMGSICGGAASAMDPVADADAIERSAKRYINIYQGYQPGRYAGLGASDAVMAILACFYLAFPRTPVPLFRKFHLGTQVLGRYAPKLASMVERIPVVNLKMSAVWCLPMYFMGDLRSVWKEWSKYLEDGDNYIAPITGIGHSAHAGGMAGGALFYMLVAHRIKQQYFTFTVHEVSRRAILMVSAFAFWSGSWVSFVLASHRSQDSNREVAVPPVAMFQYTKTRMEQEKDKDGKVIKDEHGKDKMKKKSMRCVFTPNDVGHELFKNYRGPLNMLGSTNACVLHEACSPHATLGKCDDHFKAVREWHLANPDVKSFAINQVVGPTERQCKRVIAAANAYLPSRFLQGETSLPWPKGSRSGLFAHANNNIASVPIEHGSTAGDVVED